MKKDALWKAGDTLNAEVGRFYQIRANLEGQSPREVFQRRSERVRNEKRLRQVLDEACRHWIENGSWPMMGELHAALISDRLGEGVMLAGFLYHHGMRCSKKTEKDWLDFLLIECWVAFGRKSEAARLVLL